MKASAFGTKNVILFLSLLVFIASCAPGSVVRKEPLQDNAEVMIYLQPVPETAGGLIFNIEAVSIVMEDGTEVPVSLSFNEIRCGELMEAQKLLGSGTVPEGGYKGISIKIGKAYLRGTAVLAPEDPIIVEHEFLAARKKASTLFLTLNSSELFAKDIVFEPLFALSSQKKELFTLTGYITDSLSNTVSVFNKKTMMNVSAISTGSSPMGIALDQGRGRAYVAVSRDDAILAIDLFSGQIMDTIELDPGDEPVHLALTPDGELMVSVNHGSNTVSLIDTGSMFVTGRIHVGEGPVSAVTDPLGLRAYIANSMSNSISVINLSSGVLAATIAVEGTPVQAAFNSKGDSLYVVYSDIPDMTVIDPAGLSVTGKVFIGSAALSIKADTRTGLILVGNTTGGISIIDPSASLFIDTIRTDGAVAFMTIDDQENTLFALVPGRKTLQKINLTSKKVLAEIDVGEGAHAFVVMGER